MDKRDHWRPDFPGESDIFSFLKSTPLLGCVSNDDVRLAARRSRVRAFRKGEVVLNAGAPSSWLYIIYRGQVAEFISYMGSMDVIVKTKKRLDYIGETGILTNKPYQNTAVALSRLLVLAIPKKTFSDITWRNASVAKHIIGELVERLTNAARKHIVTVYMDAPAKLAFTLVSLSSSSELGNSVNITQSEAAAAAGIARQTAAKIIGDWRADGILETLRGKIIINEPDRLLDIALNSECRR